MESFYAVLANLGPWLGGAIGGVLILVLTNRRSLLTYNVTHQRIGMSADDAVHGKVEVFFRGNLVDRLYLSVMQIRNRGIRDLENLNLKTYRGHDAMAMLTEEARIDGTMERVYLTDEYFDRVVANNAWEQQRDAGAKEEPENKERLKHDWNFKHGQRHYSVAVLNRGQILRITYLTTALPDREPAIFLTCHTKGVRVKEKPDPQAATNLFGVPIPHAAKVGLLLGLVAMTVVTIAITYKAPNYNWAAGPACFVIGLFAAVPGALAIKAYARVRAGLIG